MEITISPLTWAKRHKRSFEAVISIEDVGTRFGLRFHHNPKPDHLILRFIDLDYPPLSPYDCEPRFFLATKQDVESAIGFAADKSNLLVHCKAGIARSTAIALAIILSRSESKNEQEAHNELLRIRPSAVPNLHIVALTDELFNCKGRLIAVVKTWDDLHEENQKRRVQNREAHFLFYGLPKNSGFLICDFVWSFYPEKKSDKIWGIASANNIYYSFWGRRGDNESSLKSIKFLRADKFELKTTLIEKIRKGYKIVDTTSDAGGEYPIIETIYPGFVYHARQSLMLAKLDGSVRRESDKTP
jgi:predicted protein tyrosine phosphatase